METRWPGAWPPTSALAGDRPQRYVLRLVLVLCLSLALVACAQPRQGDGAKSPAPSPSPGTPIALSEQGQGGLGKVAFVRGGDIFALDFASGQERKLAEGKTPRWSPDGQWVYFSKGKEGWRARPDGSGLQPIGPIALFPPKGDRLAYVSEGGLRVAAPDGSQARELLPAGSDVQRFLWSPDGSRLVVERERRLSRQPPSEWGLWLVNADGSDLSLLHSAWDPQQPHSTGSCLGTWSPDGAYLSFWRCGVSGSISADGGHLLVIPVQGGEPKGIGQTLFYQDFLSWSPDGRLLAFVDPGGRDTWGYFPEGKPQGKQIKVAETASGQAWDITADLTRTHLYPSFSPDAKGIAYSSAPVVPYDRQYPKAEGAGARRIWVINTDGGGKRQLTDDPGYADERPLWSRDGGYILFARRLAVEWEEKALKAELWLMKADGSEKRRVAEGLDGGSPWFGYYGHINWDDLFAWYQGG